MVNGALLVRLKLTDNEAGIGEEMLGITLHALQRYSKRVGGNSS